MSHKVICDKCGAEKPREETEDWHIPPDPRISFVSYFDIPKLDLCPNCFENYLNIKEQADAHKKELIDNWLGNTEGG